MMAPNRRQFWETRDQFEPANWKYGNKCIYELQLMVSNRTEIAVAMSFYKYCTVSRLQITNPAVTSSH